MQVKKGEPPIPTTKTQARRWAAGQGRVRLSEGVFYLGQADVDLPRCRGVLILHIGAQEVTTVGKFGPLSVPLFLRDGDA